MAKARPWVTPTQLKEYTDYVAVKARTDAKLEADILRAENFLILAYGNAFDEKLADGTTDKYPDGPPADAMLAIKLVAEVYAYNAALNPELKGLKGETFDEYSYQGTKTLSLDGLDLDGLMLAYKKESTVGRITMRATVC